MEKMTAIIEGRGKKPIYEAPVLINKPRNERVQRERIQRVNHDNKVSEVDRLVLDWSVRVVTIIVACICIYRPWYKDYVINKGILVLQRW